MLSMRTTLLGILALIASLALATSASGQPCAPEWDVEFGTNGTTATIWDSAVYDGGTGPALYVCGAVLGEIGGAVAWGIAKWDGARWTDVGGGLFRNGEAGFGATLFVWDDGRGPALYVGGRFDHAGDVPVANVARWDGSHWEALGEGVDDEALEMCAFDDGRGPALFVGGGFDVAGGEPAAHIARWDGVSWEPLASGLMGGSRVVGSMTVFDDGRGPALFVGGDFYSAGGVPTNYIARWDGHEWSALGGVNLSRGWHYDTILEELAVFDDGSGPALFMSGNFQQVGVGELFLKWDGQSVSAPAGIVWDLSYYPETMLVHDDGAGPRLWLAGGRFGIGERTNFTTIARWDGKTWTKPSHYPSYWIFSLDFFNDGFGNDLYVFGWLNSILPDNVRIANLSRLRASRMTVSHSPLRASEQALFATTCATPGGRVYFTYSTTGLGSFFVPQLNVTLDLDAPHLAGSGIADQDGKAELIRRIPPDAAGRTVYLQAAEQGRKSEVVEAVIE